MKASNREFREMKAAVVRFAGDSGDGMQVVGERFSDTSVTVPNAIATFPDYPAEIQRPHRHPRGSLRLPGALWQPDGAYPGRRTGCPGRHEPGRARRDLGDGAEGGLLIANSAAFTEENLKMAKFASNPLDDPELGKKYHVLAIDITGVAGRRSPSRTVTLALKTS